MMLVKPDEDDGQSSEAPLLASKGSNPYICLALNMGPKSGKHTQQRLIRASSESVEDAKCDQIGQREAVTENVPKLGWGGSMPRNRWRDQCVRTANTQTLNARTRRLTQFIDMHAHAIWCINKQACYKM